jgi:hypothetical protein
MTAPWQPPLRWLISCDESGTHGAKYYGFGSLWMKWQRRGDFAAFFDQLRARHGYHLECKWKKCNQRRYKDFYLELVRYFFKRKWLAFHCIIFRKGIVDKSMHCGDYDLARRKHFTMFLSKKIERCMGRRPDREHTFRIWVDPIASRYGKAHEAVEVISNNVLGTVFDTLRPVDSVTVHDSKKTPTIQLCDVLLGAIMSAWQGEVESEAKLQIRREIAECVGWPDLTADTFPTERKLNIWYFHDSGLGDREIQTRPISLSYPL